mmetsp:Transcript_3668/g.6938  ORF Transcript_3668/g.6938 Transcript_3668/m.6938 type:complete len:106 (+) Transcript_3668:121-438(+)
MKIGTNPNKNFGVTAVTTKMLLQQVIIVARYERPVTTSCSSTVYKSLLNLFMILPIGVVSKKDIGASSTTSRRRSNIEREARSPTNMKISSLKKVAKMALKLINA